MADLTETLTAERVAKMRHAAPFIHPPSAAQDTQSLCDSHERLRLALSAAERERDATVAFIERRGYRRCDIPACNCGQWHQGHAEERLREISDSLQGAGVNGGTIHGGVLEIIRRAEAAEEAFERGQAAILRDVAKLPSPIKSYSTPPMRMVTGRQCVWCGKYWLFGAEDEDPSFHPPDNGCLWPRALAAADRKDTPR